VERLHWNHRWAARVETRKKTRAREVRARQTGEKKHLAKERTTEAIAALQMLDALLLHSHRFTWQSLKKGKPFPDKVPEAPFFHGHHKNRVCKENRRSVERRILRIRSINRSSRCWTR